MPKRKYPAQLTEDQWIIVCEALRSASSSLIAPMKQTRKRTAKATLREHIEEFEAVRDVVVKMLRKNKLAAEVPLEF